MQIVLNIYVRQIIIVYVIKRMKPLCLDPYFQYCNTIALQSFLFMYTFILLLLILKDHRERLSVRSMCENKSQCF